MQSPLADRMRPRTLSEFVGQGHLLGKGEVLWNQYEQKNLHSMIFWGPPGTGKTTLARILAERMNIPFVALSAISAGVKEVRQVIDMGRKAGKVLLFLDEIHRFNKSQQDALLGAVEDGTILLVGATTENPSFEVNAALLSRCQVYVLEPFSKEDLIRIVERALEKDEVLSKRNISFAEYEALLSFSGGDARKLLNLLEITAENAEVGMQVDNTFVERVLKRNFARYDKSGEQHYDIISAFIKSMRGSDPNGALYWLARLIRAGEDPKFIARRMLILASEDIGIANPTAMVLANNCFQAVQVIGYPECRIILSQTVIYLALSPKSNSAYMAIEKAISQAARTDSLPVPLHLRNAPTKLMKDLDYGKNYQYAHDYSGNFVDIEFLPDEISGTVFYEPGGNIREEEMRKKLRSLWKDKYDY